MTFTFWNYYILELLRFETLTFETITFSDATLSDIHVVLCYILSQYHVNGYFLHFRYLLHGAGGTFFPRVIRVKLKEGI